jgi:hypothetical protein
MKAPEFHTFDEQKCMLGFLSLDAAKKAYLQHYDNERFLGSITEMSFEDFKNKVLKTFDKPTKVAHSIQIPQLTQSFTNRRSLNSQSTCNLFLRHTFLKESQHLIPIEPTFTQRLSDITPPLQSLAHSRLGHTKIASNGSDCHSPFAHLQSSHQIPLSRTPVVPAMNPLGNQLKIGNLIIQSVTIPMMHNLSREQSTSQKTGHDHSMFQNMFTLDKNNSILCGTPKCAYVSVSTSHETYDASSSARPQEVKMTTAAFLKYACYVGAQHARKEFAKYAAGLGDPNFWQGGSEAANEPPPPPPNEEEVVLSLPTGVFQGMNTKLDPMGQKTTSVKVTPDALGQAEALAQIFQANPAAKVEIASPEAGKVTGPGEAMSQEGPGGIAPGEGMSPTQGQVTP